MELEADKFAILFLFFGIFVWLFLDEVSNCNSLREAWKDILSDLFKSKEYWEDIEREETEYDDDDDKTVNDDR